MIFGAPEPEPPAPLDAKEAIERREDQKRKGLAVLAAFAVGVILVALWVVLASPGDGAAERQRAITEDLSELGIEANFVSLENGIRIGDQFRVFDDCGGSRLVLFNRISDELLIARWNGNEAEVNVESAPRLTECAQ